MARENALTLERICRRALNYNDRGALAGLIDADTFNSVGKGYYALAATLSPYFKEGTEEDRDAINVFLDKYYVLSDADVTYVDYDSELGNAVGDLRTLLSRFE